MIEQSTQTGPPADAGAHGAGASTPPPPPPPRRWLGVTTVDLARAVGFGVWAALFVATWVNGGIRLWVPLLYWLMLGGAVVAAGTRWRWWGMVALAGALGAYWNAWGLPLADRESLLLWLMGALAVATLGRTDRPLWRLLVDWLPFAGVLILYDYSRGAARYLDMPLHVTPQIDVDRFLFFGHVPTIWLQQHLLQPHHVAWWELLVSLSYLSHFIGSYALAGWLWIRDHAAWWKYTKRFITVSYLGVATYAVLPAAPPWMASQRFDEFNGIWISRTVNRGYDWWHLHFAGQLIDKGQGVSNLTAALPSLHEAFAVLMAVTLWERVRNPFVRVLLVVYPVWMGFSLVLSGEHYVADLLMGAAYVAVIVFAWDRIDAWWEQRKAASRAEALTQRDDSQPAVPTPVA